VQIDCFDCRALVDPREFRGPWRSRSEGPDRIHERHATARVAGDVVRVRHAYVASRAGFDATNLALGAQGLSPVIDRMFGFAHAFAAEPMPDRTGFTGQDRTMTVT
jgi:hypothetical protein